ncbi:MAG: acyl-CoA dehydrogenase, partial [Kordiimonadaceae bacterium]|nr:acyl-CoA dehydrogenase [Kordiimonadaceae bacterium]
GYLVGEENKGMANMFTMMNAARLGVGLQSVAISERAYQQAAGYATERVQSAAIGAKTREAVTIIHHPDVRRMLMTMRAMTEASRAILYRNLWAQDRAHKATDEAVRCQARGEADLLTPISKAFTSDISIEVTSMGIQVHGGMGFSEETGAAQHYRDCRILPIYEGTNGIQALDLVGRKLGADGGAHWNALIKEMQDFTESMTGALAPEKAILQAGVDAVASAAAQLVDNGFDAIVDTAAAATPYLRLFGTVLGGYLLAKQAAEAENRFATNTGDPAFLRAKIATARYFIEQLVPSATSLLGPIKAGADRLMDLDIEDFARK